MDASSYSQVFISFRGKDVRKHFVSFLDHALREANINVFTDEDEFLGADLVHLLKRIEESEIALVIFSEDFTSSYWCLDLLAKIKELKDQGRLIVIPIFYKVQPSVVKYLKGQFGDNFRDLKRNHQHQPLRTQKWEEALVSIPETKGIPLAEQRTNNDFITSMVIKIQRLLEHMAMRRNQYTLLPKIKKSSTMAATSSSSGVAKISKGPQVFINFRGEGLRHGFMAHLEAALKKANINYFIDTHEQVGTKLQNLSVRIEQSRVALVIFSKEYTTSVRCLDELAKIKECMDKGSLIGVPIFYKLKTSVVSNLEGYFGDNFRTLKRNNQHDLLRTQKWEEALTSIPQTVGMKLSEKSDQSDREFIESIVDKVKSLLDDILMEKDVDQKRQVVNRVEEGPPQHQVFINFRELELRNGFVSHLVKALQSNDINVFIDKLEDRGQPIEILMKRIEKSRVAVVIFSGRYTESIWCLRELAKIKDFMDKGILIAIPIFYKVAPATVKFLMGDFGDEFRKMARDDERKEKWEDAFLAIADIMGTIVNENSDEGEIIEKTVEDVMKALIRIR